jgi:hypothetical protein
LCRGLLGDFSEIHAQWLPSHPSFNVPPDSHGETRLRQSILRRARQEGAQFSEAASLGRKSPPPTWGFYLRFSAVSVLVLLCAAIVISVLRIKASLAAREVGRSPISTQSGSVQNAVNKSLPDQLVEAKPDSAEARRSLDAMRLENARLRKQLQDERAALSTATETQGSAENRIAELEKQLESAQENLAAREAELETTKSTAATTEAVAIAEQQEIQRLHSEGAAKTASLEREREMLSAGREIRDLIAARNLHIIDVYDTSVDGRTSKAFGRVFYTEGKSLVFYAYDLTPHHAGTAKFAFYLWGKRDGAPQYVKVLGQLNRDDQQQKRWALTITDSNVLAEIDSVFVTLEPAGNDASKPTGKPLLSAFLGSPANHP